jgi:hypothetical protein
MTLFSWIFDACKASFTLAKFAAKNVKLHLHSCNASFTLAKMLRLIYTCDVGLAIFAE